MNTGDHRGMRKRTDGAIKSDSNGAQTRFNLDSEELLLSKSAICLAPASPMLFPGGKDKREYEHWRMNRRTERREESE